MDVLKTNLPGVLQIEPKVFGDSRGFFIETYSEQRYRESGVDYAFVQDNHSRSSQGVLRGLHYQLNHPQGKLVRVVRGSVFDVAVDIRVGSPTFGKAAWTILSDQNHYQFFIPPGFAHGFCVISEFADFEYKCTDYYHPEDEGSLLWNDPALGIPWPIINPTISEKDAAASNLADIPEDRLPVYSGD
ncbi:MAG: dTDP-4-dehydrorhamnose 3,5-epimerase [Gammaproteobacteria bacterium]